MGNDNWGGGIYFLHIYLDTLIVSIVFTARLKFLTAKLIEEGQVTSIERRRAELNTCNMLQLNKTNKK